MGMSMRSLSLAVGGALTAVFAALGEPRTDVISVVETGAVGDGRHDDTAAFQRALDRAGKTGGIVLAPPQGPGRGYVITRTLTFPEGVSLVGAAYGFGCNVRAVFRPEKSNVVGSVIFARPAPDQYRNGRRLPLFEVGPGCTIRGLWIFYDRQPLPSDEELADPRGPYGYASFEQARKRFLSEHVKPYGPTIYAKYCPNLVVEDVICDRYVDFAWLRRAGKCHFERITLHGFRKAFVVAEARDVIHFRNIALVPNVGPQSPGGPYRGKHYTWAYGIIAGSEDNVGIHLGVADGFVFDDVFCFGVHTGLRLGRSGQYPMRDPVSGEVLSEQAPGSGPWGSITNMTFDQCVVGVHFVWPSYLGNRMTNVMIFPSFDDGTRFPAVEGTGSMTNIARQAAFLVSPSHCIANCHGRTPTLLAGNVTVASFQDAARFGPLAARMNRANGRVFLVGGDLRIEANNLQINTPCTPDWLWAAGRDVRRASIRARGVILDGQSAADISVILNRNARP